MPRLEYDRDADAIYIHLRDIPYAFGRDLDDDRRIDFAADGLPRGLELLAVSRGVRIDDLPEREEIARLLKEQRIPVFT